MSLDEDHGPISPGLPVLDELGDALGRHFSGRERERRRQRAAGVLAGVIAAVVATSVALVGGGADQARATEIATGHTAEAGWRLMLVESDSGACLQLRPRDSRDSDRSCRAPGRRVDSAIARAHIDGQAFVYGFFSEAAPALRLSDDGETQRLADEAPLPSGRDPRRRGRGFARAVPTKPLPVEVGETPGLPAGARFFVVALPRDSDGTVIVEPRGAGSHQVVIRVPDVTSR